VDVTSLLTKLKEAFFTLGLKALGAIAI